MSLNTPDEIKNVIEVPTGLTDGQIQGFLDDANLIVTEDLSGKGLSDARLKVIEKWLGAHLTIILTERGGLKVSKDGDAEDSYTDMSPRGQANISGLALTRYGQQAIFFDTSKTLAKMSKEGSLSAKFKVEACRDGRRSFWGSC